MVRFLEVFKPLMRIVPEVKVPERKVSFKMKILYTVLILIIYLIMSNIPLWGIPVGVGSDYFYYWRILFASNRGTLTELGIGPIVTAGLILQVLAGSKIIKVDFSDPYDRSMFTGTQKVLAILMTAIQAIAYISFGAYGALTFEVGVFVFLQLFFSGIIIILMDEMIQKGWGIGSGVSLFIAANVTGSIFWNMFSPAPASDGYFRGGILAFFQGVIAAATGGTINGNPPDLIYLSFTRYPDPSLVGFLATIAVVVIVVYFESVRVEIPLKMAKYRGYTGRYPIRFLYVSNIPVILAQAIYANILLVSQGVWNTFNKLNDNVFLNFIAMFKTGSSGQLEPIGGLVYFLTPPRGIVGEGSIAADPLRAVIYLLIFTILCAALAKIWVEVSGISSRDIAQQLLTSPMQIPGFRQSLTVYETILNRYIPTVTILGGLFVGLLTVFADFLGAFGTGMGVLLLVGIVFQYLRTIAEEQQGELAAFMMRRR
ncbi:MAG: preprotein translocase subunit SecY [Candidatus Odinarchaeum yellowstonii]|uniref:Preprotein translocase subunit SecY n=1 Tax=Odinarchaeota yellowstonii (strain LCB_4) TaxID=1841599 RepID=A0AAF0D1E3_ODILC|nr:MAG: preprotein translocase subunit SecY [Candidatus Odinarchaeum yellowstonii]